MTAGTTTIRVRKETHEALAEIAQLEGRPIAEVLARLVEAHHANAMFDHHNAVMTGLGQPAAVPAEIDREQQLLDGTLLDGLRDDPWPVGEGGDRRAKCRFRPQPTR